MHFSFFLSCGIMLYEEDWCTRQLSNFKIPVGSDMPQIGGDGVYGGTSYHRTSIAVQTHNSLISAVSLIETYLFHAR
jgi:hypothetical protein